ncbi:MAG: CDP-diacylglycerol--glycerol-3-phosphate 3-phosphatidyltransferase [Candidatus Omnitrophota bacterium]|nr:CDP-diacylglycerol--glycerol-3-phosphate 3-phosphatidyltransferase [Candidatus Omnitrophota bacterium]
MTLPDKLTVSRIFLTFIFMCFVFSHGVLAKALALFTFILASFTDFLDGFIAKKRNISTDFGKLMDPIADKILVLAAFLAFVEMKLIPAWMVVIIILREITITGLRVFALARGKVIPADEGGKQKMVSQVAAILAILLFLIFREAGIERFNFWNGTTEAVYKNAIWALMLITVALTLISGVSYLVKNKGVYSHQKTGR